MTADPRETGDSSRTLIETLYRQYSESLRRFLSHQRLSRDEVADIVQETYYRVHRAGGVDGIRNPKAFLFRVAKNIRLNAAKHLRSRVEIDEVDAAELDVASDEPGPYRSFQSQQELAVVRAALEELAPTCRQAFVMNRFENMTFGEIAAELDLSVSMIEKHVSHAIFHLRRRLEQAERPALRRGPWRAPKQT